MRRLALCLSLLFVLVSPNHAAPFSGSGTVYLLRSHALDIAPDFDWFSLVGVTSLGICKTADAGYVVLRIHDDIKGQRMFTLVLAAKTSGTPLTVWVDDTILDPYGYCYVRAVQ